MGKINLIIDCDTGVDDAIAIIMAVLSEDINLIGISLCAGNANLENVYKNTRQTLDLLDKDVEIVKGYPEPLEVGPKYWEENIELVRNLALENFYSRALDLYDNVCLLSIGPMTNIYWLLKNKPEMFAKIDKFVSMGGAYLVRGNVREYAEYNYWADPFAADYVYKNSNKLIHMTPLDITEKVYLDEKDFQTLKSINPKIGGFIEKICKYNFSSENICRNKDKYYLHDPLSLGLIIDGDLMSGFKAYSRIICTDHERGKLIVDKELIDNKANSYIYNKVDSQGFLELVFSLLKDKD